MTRIILLACLSSTLLSCAPAAQDGPPVAPEDMGAAWEGQPAPEGTPAAPPRPSGSYAALEWWSNMRAYPERDIPGSGFAEAFAQKRVASKRMDRTAMAWQAIGPHNLSGRMLAVVFNPENPSTLLAGSASGGLWRSYSAGQGTSAWHRVDIGAPVLSVSALAYAPGDSSTIYLGTGEVYNRDDRDGRGLTHRPTRGSYGLGIYVSRDAGETWQKSLDWSSEQGRGIQMIKVNPLRPSTVWAATTEGLYRSYDSGRSWDLAHSVVMATDVAFHPADTSRVFAAHGNLGTEGRGIYRSTDGGASWERLTGGLPVVFGGKALVTISPSDPAVVYASIGNGYRSSDGNWLVRSEDGGDSWETVFTENYVGSQGWYSHDVAVHPDNPDRLTVVGFLIFRSTNAGRSLNPATVWQGWTVPAPPIGGPDGPSNHTHPDHHAIAVHPDDPDYMLFATDGGIYRTLDGARSFRAMNGGLQTIQFYPGMSNSLHEPTTAMAGTQDNSTLLYRGTLEWRILNGGDGAWTAIDPVNPGRFYWSSQFLAIRKSSDRGINAESITPPEANRFTGFVAPYVLSRADPARLYAGRDRVYTSLNRGASWVAGRVLTGEPLVSMAASETSAGVVYAVTAPGNERARVFSSRNGGDSWTDVTAGLPDRYLVDIVLDPTNHDRLFLAVAGFGSDHVFRSDNGGQSWTAASSGLPDLPTWSVAIDPDFPDTVFAGNDLGVFISSDSGSNWEPFGDGLPESVIAMDLDVSRVSRKLRVATHGNGMYERQLEGSTDFKPPVAVSANYSLLTVYPNPARQAATVTYVMGSEGAVHLGLYDAGGRLQKLIFDGTKGAGRIFHTMDVSGLAPAVYYLSLSSPSVKTTTSVVVTRWAPRRRAGAASLIAAYKDVTRHLSTDDSLAGLERNFQRTLERLFLEHAHYAVG
jgi:photosystem II stability/assembly factor-like uncharacterized protein